jgi:hypothetical protein
MLEKIADKWLGPSGIVVIIGLIIWLVQLNVGFVSLKSLSERIAAQQDSNAEVVQSMLLTQERVSHILLTLERRMSKVEEYTEHDDERVQELRGEVKLYRQDIKNHFDNHEWWRAE